MPLFSIIIMEFSGHELRRICGIPYVFSGECLGEPPNCRNQARIASNCWRIAVRIAIHELCAECTDPPPTRFLRRMPRRTPELPKSGPHCLGLRANCGPKCHPRLAQNVPKTITCSPANASENPGIAETRPELPGIGGELRSELPYTNCAERTDTITFSPANASENPHSAEIRRELSRIAGKLRSDLP